MSEQAIPQPSHETNNDAKILTFPIMNNPETSPQPVENPLFESSLSDNEVYELAHQLRYTELAMIDDIDDQARYILKRVLETLDLDIPQEKIVESERKWVTKQEMAADRQEKIYGEFGDFMMEMLDKAEAVAGNSDLLRLVDAARKDMNKNYKTAAIYAHRTALIIINMELGDISLED